MRKLVWIVLSALALATLPIALPTTAQEQTKAVQPTQGSAGTTFSFYITGYGSGDKLAYWVTGPDGKTYGSEEYRTRSDGKGGRADWTWTSPADARPGVWVMAIQRVRSDRDEDKQKEEPTETIPFTITGADGQPVPGNPAPPSPGPQPGDQAVQPGSGPAGTEFAFFATGFRSGETVSYWVNAPDGTTRGSNGYRTDANGNGRADWEWESPESAKPGTWIMVARGLDSGIERTIPFEIR